MESAFKCIVAGFTVVAFIGAAYADGDPEKGKEIFMSCGACHPIDAGAARKLGPNLNKIFGAQAGTRKGSSHGMEEAGKNGLDWDEDNLSEFLKNPRDFIPSRFGIRHTPMKRLVGSKKDRDDVIAYLKTL